MGSPWFSKSIVRLTRIRDLPVRHQETKKHPSTRCASLRMTEKTTFFLSFFQGDEVFVGFAFSDDGEFIGVDEDFSGAATSVVVA